MTDPRNVSRERLHDLLADRVFDELDERERRELETLIPQFPDDNVEEFEFAAAAIDLAYAADRLEPMPTDVRARLETRVFESMREAGVGVASPERPAAEPGRATTRDDARRGTSAPAPRAQSDGRSFFDRLGWLAAAACLLVAVGAWWPQLKSEPSVAARRATLEKTAGDLVGGEWATQAYLGDKVVGGDFVWSPAEQEGYMRFEGLPVNDPAKEQYQLWLIDPNQEHPIDGGVFDARSDGTFDIDIHAKLGVEKLAAAAITIEKPGGVVVSVQDKLILLAEPKPL